MEPSLLLFQGYACSVAISCSGSFRPLNPTILGPKLQYIGTQERRFSVDCFDGILGGRNDQSNWRETVPDPSPIRAIALSAASASSISRERHRMTISWPFH